MIIVMYQLSLCDSIDRLSFDVFVSTFDLLLLLQQPKR